MAYKETEKYELYIREKMIKQMGKWLRLKITDKDFKANIITVFKYVNNE